MAVRNKWSVWLFGDVRRYMMVQLGGEMDVTTWSRREDMHMYETAGIDTYNTGRKT